MKEQETFVEGLLEILKKREMIKADEAMAMKKMFRDHSKVAFDKFLLQEGLVSRADLLNALSIYYNVPAFDVIGYWFKRELLQKFPQAFLIRHRIIPLEVDKNILIVVASRPDNPELLPLIGEFVSYSLRFMVGLGEDIEEAVKEFYQKALTEDSDPDRAGRRKNVKAFRGTVDEQDEE